ncbi:UNVERIFIED_CONTAM: hypothetical protein Sangu_2902800 [Sesamum angustifolium]|uniref:DDE Tnp4 domain-containing protein n=1 Tax=Sesamum angustifolium TaxID=2727405 RepID=A0AAW2INV2_9LAMI
MSRVPETYVWIVMHSVICATSFKTHLSKDHSLISYYVNLSQGCLGALDGTLIDVQVPLHEIGRYRTRKGQIAVNVLSVCNPNMQFIYALSGWEESVADSHVLCDAIHRDCGLRVPSSNYYLCDNGYANVEGFLMPYRGVRYHLREWDHGTGGPRNKEELFNLKHSSACNV